MITDAVRVYLYVKDSSSCLICFWENFKCLKSHLILSVAKLRSSTTTTQTTAFELELLLFNLSYLDMFSL